MSVLPLGSWLSPGTPIWMDARQPARIQSIEGLSSINGSPYLVAPEPEPLPTSYSALSISSATVSSINGASYPPISPPSGPTILSGKVAFGTNGQTVTYSTPFQTSVSVVIQGTANAAGVNGFFTIATYGSLSEFRIFYSGELIYGPIEIFWIAVGS